MNPTFEPILGGGFDQIAAQRFGWAQQNNQVDVGNINRLNEAEQARNNWMLRNQQILQQQADSQDKSDEEAQKFAEGQRQFDVSAGLSAEANKTRYGQEAARTDYYNKALAKQQADATTSAATVDSAAQTLAPRVHEFGTAASDAQSKMDEAFAALQSKPAELQASLPEGVFYNGKGFKATNPKSEKAASGANLELQKAQGDYVAATRQFNAQQKNFSDLAAHASKKYGLEVSHDGDQWVVKNPKTQKTYRPDGTAKPGPKPAQSDSAAQSTFAGTNRFAPGETWPGFTDFGTAPTDQSADASASRFGLNAGPPGPIIANGNRFSSAPANPYIAGRQYGNLRYNGGDPNDQNNWQQVQ